MLGVTRTAAGVEIKSAYRRLAMQFHPDRNPGSATAEDKFKECNEAYAVLSDQQKRVAYDLQFAPCFAAQRPSAYGEYGPDIEDIFSEVFGTRRPFGGYRPGQGRRKVPVQGTDINAAVTIALEDAAFGVEKEVTVGRSEPCLSCRATGVAGGTAHSRMCQQCHGLGQVLYQHGYKPDVRTCPACRGSGTLPEKVCLKCEGKRVVIHPYTFSVNIPSGIESGCRILYQGCGNVGLDGGVAGDIYVTINIDQHPIFSREGANLHCSIPVSFTQVALGTSLKIPTLERDDVSIKIKAGTQAGTTFRLKDRGMPVRKSLSRGDLFVKVNVVIPETLTTRQKELLEELAYTLGTEPPKKRRRRKVKA